MCRHAEAWGALRQYLNTICHHFVLLVAICRQGNDWGPQYQAALFPHDDSQKRMAERTIAWARAQLDCVRRDSKDELSDSTFTVAARAVQEDAQRETPRSTLKTSDLGAVPFSNDESAGEDSLRVMRSTGDDQRHRAHSRRRKAGNVSAAEARESTTDVRDTVAAGSQGDVDRDMKSNVSGQSGSVGGKGAAKVVTLPASLPWWEGDSVRTVIVPIREEDFILEVDEDANVL